jgi:hypothetical protein
MEMEARRALEYITVDQAQAWATEVRRGREKVQECKIEIHNARTFKRIANYTPSCIEEKKALAKAERRLHVAELKVEAVRHWGRIAEQAFREFQARLAQFISMLDGELPKGVAALERMMASLDRYFLVEAPAALPQTDAVGDKDCSSRTMAGTEGDDYVADVPEQSDPLDTAEKDIETKSEPVEFLAQEEQ